MLLKGIAETYALLQIINVPPPAPAEPNLLLEGIQAHVPPPRTPRACPK